MAWIANRGPGNAEPNAYTEADLTDADARSFTTVVGDSNHIAAAGTNPTTEGDWKPMGVVPSDPAVNGTNKLNLPENIRSYADIGAGEWLYAGATGHAEDYASAGLSDLWHAGQNENSSTSKNEGDSNGLATRHNAEQVLYGWAGPSTIDAWSSTMSDPSADTGPTGFQPAVSSAGPNSSLSTSSDPTVALGGYNNQYSADGLPPSSGSWHPAPSER